jgi:hypothetical protein
MIDIHLSNCTPKNTLAYQLEANIPGFSWNRNKHGHLVESFSDAFSGYMPIGSQDAQDGSTCGFCGKQGITTEYWFEKSQYSPEYIEETFNGNRYRFFMPNMLVTGSKCKEFPFIGNYVRGLNGVIMGVRFDSTDKNALLRVMNMRLHKDAPVNALKYKMLYLPVNYVSFMDRDAMFSSLLNNFEFFIFTKRKKLPSSIPAIGIHRETRAALGSKWYPSDAWSSDYYSNIVLGIPFSTMIENNARFGHLI